MEMVVSMLIFGIIMGMVVGILSPAAKLFLRMQRLQRAQVILDNTILELYDITENASRYVKIYDSPDIITGTGADAGSVLEFVNPEGYVTVVSTGGCDETRILIGGTKVDTAKAVSKGRLLVRYYVNDSADAAKYEYTYMDSGGAPVARAVLGAFSEGYYMGNYLEVKFYYGDAAHPTPSEAVASIMADVSLYSADQDGNKGELIVQETGVVLNLRYAAVRNGALTAQKAA